MMQVFIGKQACLHVYSVPTEHNNKSAPACLPACLHNHCLRYGWRVNWSDLYLSLPGRRSRGTSGALVVCIVTIVSICVTEHWGTSWISIHVLMKPQIGDNLIFLISIKSSWGLLTICIIHNFFNIFVSERATSHTAWKNRALEQTQAASLSRDISVKHIHRLL